jgi:hypothetical protein
MGWYSSISFPALLGDRERDIIFRLRKFQYYLRSGDSVLGTKFNGDGPGGKLLGVTNSWNPPAISIQVQQGLTVLNQNFHKKHN